MKAVILAGGYGTRISEESSVKPKPMVDIGGRPILWHIMKSLNTHGVSEFIICLGYKGHQIKDYFANYFMQEADFTVDLASGERTYHNADTENWRVSLIETGTDTMTGGRIKRVAPYLDDEPFLMTYGDGVADIDIAALQTFHKSHGRKATVTSVAPPGRFGALDVEAGMVKRFMEKPPGDRAHISGGFFILDPSVIDYIDGDKTVWEKAPLERLAAEQNLMAYQHDGFWQPMDTLRDANYLRDLWEQGTAPWKTW